MSRKELAKKLELVKQIVENTQRTIQFTNIPVYVLLNYIQEETGINMETIKG